MALRGMVQSRAALALGTAVAIAVPVMTLPRLPHISPWPVLAGLIPWIFGKYVLCALRWRAVTPPGAAQPLTRGWFLRANAEAELLGLLTPGHVGADIWRIRRLTGTGLGRGDALLSVGADRLVGAVGLIAFVAFAVPSLPPRMALIAAGVATVAVLVALAARRFFPRLLPSGPLPPPRAFAGALLLAAAYQLTIAGMLLGTVAATGNAVSPFALLAAFGASQLAAVVPGVNGASPRDGALVVALVALGVPWIAATAAVTIRATLAWLPALALGGLSMWLLRRHAAPAAA
jgi:hypothetical protein